MHLAQPGDLVARRGTRPRPRSHSSREVARRGAPGVASTSPGADEPLAPVERERLQQVEPGDARRLVGDGHQRLVDEVREQIGDVLGGDVVARAHRFGRVERAAAGEHREPLEHAPLVVEEQVVAPLDDGAQRLLAGERGAGAAGEQPEAVVEPGRELADRDGPDPPGRQLDREREPVEPGADLADDDLGRPRRARTRSSPPARSANSSTASSIAIDGIGHTVSPPMPSGSRLVARIRRLGHADEQRLGDARRLVDDVLAVVEHEQRGRGRR